MSPWATYLERRHGCWKSELLDIVPKDFLACTAAYNLVPKPRNVLMWLTGSHPQLLLVLLQTVRDELDVAPGLICRVYEIADADMVEQAYNKN
jgi:hypothetical protein